MEPVELENRLLDLEDLVRTRLDEAQHFQRMHTLTAARKFEASLADLRRELTAMASRTASVAELQEIRQQLQASVGDRKWAEPGWQEAVELVPRLMAELARLREEGAGHRPAGPAGAAETGTSGLGEALTRLEIQEAEQARRLQDLEGRTAGEAQEQARALEAVRGEMKRALEDLEGSFQTRLEARPAPEPRGAGVQDPTVQSLLRRVEALESRPSGAGDLAGALESLAERVETLEQAALGDGETAMLALKLESLELGMGVERERVREVFRDLLEEHGLLLRHLESRMTLLVQDFHRLSEGLADRPN